MGEGGKDTLRVHFDARVRLEFHGATITSDAGLLACRELDDALGLTASAPGCLRESRGGRNVQHQLVPLLRQSVYKPPPGGLRGHQESLGRSAIALKLASRGTANAQVHVTYHQLSP